VTSSVSLSDRIKRLEEEGLAAIDQAASSEALEAARSEGLCRFIGVTGHGTRIPGMHLRSLEAHPFDSVLFPYNFTMLADPAYRADVEALLAVCAERGVAVQTIKSVARGPWAKSPQNRSTWYEPLEDQADIDLAVHWVMGVPGVFINTVGDMTLLPRVLSAAQRFQAQPGDDQMNALLERAQVSSLFGIGDPAALAV